MADFSQPSPYASPVCISSPRTRLFALLIGINDYKAAEIDSLRGAVADALAFKDYLMSHLQVPRSQITALLKEKASRSAIIRAFQRLQDDPRIKDGDPIFIFYAGHGSELLSPRPWHTGGAGSKFQVIVPQDYCTRPGREVHVIPDRTIGALLKAIADKKGNNITVVFDCCHAASGTRGPKENNLSTTLVLTRSVELESTIPEDLDQDIWDISTRGMYVPPGYQHAGLNSHVLLAACGAGEKAKEVNGHGEFSTALLTLLRTTGPDTLRYRDILHKIDQIPSQNPQCEGINQNRYLFDGKILPLTYPPYAIQHQKNGSIVMQAGSAHGVTLGATFAVYPDSGSIYERPLGNFVIRTLSDFSSIMAPASRSLPFFLLPPQAVAVQTNASLKEDLRLYIPPRDHSLLSLIWNSNRDRSNITVTRVGRELDAHLAISRGWDKVVFQVTDRNVTQYGFHQRFDLNHAELDGDPKRLNHILKGVAHYYWLLYHIHPERSLQVMNSIQIEFHKLIPSSDHPDHPDLRPFGPNLCIDNRIEFVAEEGYAYGLTLTNLGPHNYFPNVLYFDNTDLTVDMDYHPPTSGPFKPDVPLPAGRSLTIGYGAGGSKPRMYIFRPEHTVQVGFFKLLISNKPLGDLSHLTQTESPFSYYRGAGRCDWKRDIEIWSSLLVPVIYRPPPPSWDVYRSSTAMGPHVFGGPSSSSSRMPYEIWQQFSDVMNLGL
ncbi:hypothetical protein GALMADRAFT_250798 [Galerina marginata CBS 339.88]|uniref:Peptidase C14 caspase domain-containing protein n=1 Tax=Galerina marginata (strain CBS 339.88) TaxID=685588 RepID=A0A067ST04_GALM3|nr:hypothetical protein GALMADRAFT_250798 [Galerina marginata CBS 339.88]